MNQYFAWFGLSGTFVLTCVLSLTAVFLALLFRTKDRILCAVAMLFCSGGDIVLGGLFGIRQLLPGASFFLGAGLFIIGHFFYIGAYLSLIRSSGCRIRNKGLWAGIAVTAAIILSLTVYMSIIGTFPGAALYGICLLYAVIIGADLSVIWSYAYSKRSFRSIVALGVFAFFLSDLIIGVGKLCGISCFDGLIWWLYPIGQFSLILCG